MAFRRDAVRLCCCLFFAAAVVAFAKDAVTISGGELEAAGRSLVARLNDYSDPGPNPGHNPAVPPPPEAEAGGGGAEP